MWTKTCMTISFSPGGGAHPCSPSICVGSAITPWGAGHRIQHILGSYQYTIGIDFHINFLSTFFIALLCIQRVSISLLVWRLYSLFS